MSKNRYTPGAAHPKSMVLLAAGVYVPAALACAAVIVWRQDAAEAQRRLFGHNAMKEVALGAFAGMFSVSVVQVLRYCSRELRRLERALTDLMGPLDIASILILAATSAVSEELFFRGLLQPIFGLWVATATFALAHFPLRREFLIWPILAAVMGLVLGWLFDRRQTLPAPITAHFVYNAVNLHLLSRRARQTAEMGAGREFYTRS